ncbi:MAG: glycosyltransferase family 9 protein [Cytophagales bacterium]|nr:glycosyltransferase family 9 protein [Cytophagales bacterium]
MTPNDCPRILLIQTAYIGDVILATATLETLHHSYPCAQIDVLIKKGNEGIFHKHPFVNYVHTWQKDKHKFINLIFLILIIRKRKYTHIVNLHRHFSSGLICALSAAKNIYGFDKNPFSFTYIHKAKHTFDNIHEVERNHSVVAPIAKSDIVPRPALYPHKYNFEKINLIDAKPFITIAPASVWHTKQWPADKWVAFIDSVPKDYYIYLLGSKSDKSLCQNILTATINKNTINYAGHLELLDTAALMSKAVMNYTNDSAPLHIAGAMNAPVCVVYCSTVPSFGFGPLSQISYIVQTNDKLSCRPCGIHGKKSCPQTHFKCATDIPIDKLLSVLNIKT